jgi:hypothetical protein
VLHSTEVENDELVILIFFFLLIENFEFIRHHTEFWFLKLKLSLIQISIKRINYVY